MNEDAVRLRETTCSVNRQWELSWQKMFREGRGHILGDKIMPTARVNKIGINIEAWKHSVRDRWKGISRINKVIFTNKI